MEIFIYMHIETSLDKVLNGILSGTINCTDVITTLCPNNCTGNGVCIEGKRRFSCKLHLNKNVFI